MAKPKTLDEAFSDKYQIVTETGCWIWTANTYRDGYGQLKNKGKCLAAHRVSYELHVGDIPVGMQVLHKCDTPACVNPDHLFIGTCRDNIADCISKNRNTKGSMVGNSKLREIDVINIRGIYKYCKCTYQKIADIYNVHELTIRRIITNKAWKHV